MKTKYLSPTISLGVGIALVGCGRLFPVGDVFRELIALPAVGALSFALFTLVRDEARFQKDQLIESEHRKFTLAASSHMAIVAFDKHVAFCDEYLSKLDELIVTFLSGSADDSKFYEYQKELAAIRRKFTIWETSEVSAFLDKVGVAIDKVGTSAFLLRTSTDERVRLTKHGELYSAFHEIFSFSEKPEERDLRNRLIDAMRAHLGAAELATLRVKVFADALRTT